MKQLLLLTATLFVLLNLTHAQPGTLDPSFGKGGIVKTSIGAGNATYYKEAFQKNGKIIALGIASVESGSGVVVGRYNTNGSPDKTFGDSGIIFTGISPLYSGATFSLAVQGDDKIVVGGEYSLVRYNANGTLDTTFSDDGKLTSAVYIGSIVIQGNGKILAGGNFLNENGDYNPAVARYNTNGQPDKSFGANGISTIDYFTIFRGFESMAIQKDGQIVATGIYYVDYEDPVGGILVARFNKNGAIDVTFDASEEDYSWDNSAVAVQNDGKIVVAGSVTFRKPRTFVSRYNSDGSKDVSFNARDMIGKQAGSTALALQKDEKIVVSGAKLLRFNTNGSVDSAFNTNAAGKAGFTIQDIKISDNKLYAAGGGALAEVARYFLAGTNTAPTVTITSPANNTVYPAPASIAINATASDSDGTIKSVKLYNGTTYLKTDFTSPYSYTLSNLAAGTYSITAKATDNNGAETISAAVIVKVNKAPAVRITSPANNAAFTAPANITVNALAADADGSVYSVKFYLDSAYLKTDFTSPYSYTLSNLAAGTYTITARATDNNGSQTISAPVTVTVSPETGTICAEADEGQSLNLTAPAGTTITSIRFASYGTPGGNCGNYTIGSCNASNSRKVVEEYALNQNSVSILADNSVFGDPCIGTVKRLYVEAVWTRTSSGAVPLSSKEKENRNSFTSGKTSVNEELSLRLSPNPAGNIVNIQTSGLTQNKPATLSIISISGNVLKTINISKTTTQLDVSTLVGGVYTIRIMSGDKVVFKQFVKL